MTATINANTTTGVVVTSDTSGALALQTANTTAMTINSSQVVNFANSPTVAGSALPSGAMTLISTLTASTSASLSWTGLSGYDRYFVQFENFKPSSIGSAVYLNLGYGSTPTYFTSGYYTAFMSYGDLGAINSYNSSNFGFAVTKIYGTGSSTANEYCHGSFYITGAINSGCYAVQGISTYIDTGNSNVATYTQSGQILNSGNNLTAVILTFSGIGNGVNIVSGKASLYGISS